MVAVSIMLVCLIPVLLLINSTRTETSRAVHRFRVMELINETLDWVHTCPYARIDDLAGFATGEVIGIPITKNENGKLDPFLAEDSSAVEYSGEYSGQIKRTVDVKTVPGEENRLKKVEVLVNWTEANQAFAYRLATLVFNEENPDY
jgi:hypothetical protein